MTDGPPTRAPRGSGNRRHAPRYRVKDLAGKLLYDQTVRVLDISLAGVSVEGSQRLMPGRSYHISIPQADEPIQQQATVVWCRLLGTHRQDVDVVPVFRAGLRFDQELEATGRRLLQQLAQASARGFGTRLRARFKMTERESALLGGNEPFTVQTLSRSGMATVMAVVPRQGTRLEFLLVLDGAEVEIRGRVAGVREEGEEFVVGIEFEQLDEEAAAALDAHLENLADESGPEPEV